jgi:transposase InsO family protein
MVKAWKTFPGLGYRKLADYLKVNRKRARRILRKYCGSRAIKPRVKPQRQFPNLVTHITEQLINHPDKLARGNWILKSGKNGYRMLIEPTRPYQLWVADWKEFQISFLGITVYIFIIIDVYTRQLKGLSCSLTKDTQAALNTARMAVDSSSTDPLFNPRELIVHSDQGGAYQAEEYTTFWKSLGASISMTDPGKPTQNPYAEAFISILSRFWLSQREYLSAVELEKSLKRFFDLYNRKWKHGGIGNQTPNERLASYRATANHISKIENLCPKTDS